MSTYSCKKAPRMETEEKNRNVDVFLQFLLGSHTFTVKSDSNHGHSQDAAAQDPQSVMTNTL